MNSKKDIPTKETKKNNIGKYSIIFQEFFYTDINSIFTFSSLLKGFVKILGAIMISHPKYYEITSHFYESSSHHYEYLSQIL